ncbi:MAG TPA: hypothetical protein DIC53_00010, partial [Synergistaceae bacterium]|nr:hypothetical protein [Synergistaceae bacterium]
PRPGLGRAGPARAESWLLAGDDGRHPRLGGAHGRPVHALRPRGARGQGDGGARTRPQGRDRGVEGARAEGAVVTPRPVLSVDFGTTKTYFSKCPAEDPSPVSVDFGDGRDGLLTAILYRDGKDPLIGQTALDEFGEATTGERAGLRLVTNFKPEIALSGEARTAATDYLAAVLAEAGRQRLDVDPSVRQVLFGVPSEADDGYRAALKRVAEAAGYGTPEFVDEPKGALLYHLKQREISVDQALGGVLVVDFGGGTCDFALLEGGRVTHSWGDMLLGGRLFDDLFHQWLLDQNPGLEEDLKARGASYFVGTYLCREA